MCINNLKYSAFLHHVGFVGCAFEACLRVLSPQRWSHVTQRYLTTCGGATAVQNKHQLANAAQLNDHHTNNGYSCNNNGKNSNKNGKDRYSRWYLSLLGLSASVGGAFGFMGYGNDEECVEYLLEGSSILQNVKCACCLTCEMKG